MNYIAATGQIVCVYSCTNIWLSTKVRNFRNRRVYVDVATVLISNIAKIF